MSVRIFLLGAYDFEDATITCLEKERTPRKRTVRQLCHILLGGDRLGVVGYHSLPPLAQDVYDRLAPLGVDLSAKTNQRALLDFKLAPELLSCSQFLWRLNVLLGSEVVQPIMGQRKLGHKPLQESWEIRIGKHQGTLIQLAYEGVTVEQVLAQQLMKAAHKQDALAANALRAAEDSLLYLDSERLTAELGVRATALLRQEEDAEDAPDIFGRVRRLVHFYRITPQGLPTWLEQFVVTGYSHYATLLPRAFTDRGTTPSQIAAMLGFIFTLESLALALGCQRSELTIAVQQAGQGEIAADKMGLLWTTEWLLSLRPLQEIRSLLPDLIPRLQPHSRLFNSLLKEAASGFPQTLSELDGWQMPWEVAPAGRDALQTEAGGDGVPDVLEGPKILLQTYGDVADVMAAALGQMARWEEERQYDSHSN